MRKADSFETAIGKFTSPKLGSETKVTRYGDDFGEKDMILISGQNFPNKGITSYATVGLSKSDQDFNGKTVNVELLGACATQTPAFDNIMASCAFDQLRNATPIVYGGSIEGILDQYEISETLRHITFVSPFLFEGFDPQEFEGKTVHWLMIIPISNAELDYLDEHGIDALEDKFEEYEIDIFDINRLSCV
jgi:antitoxin YqcF